METQCGSWLSCSAFQSDEQRHQQGIERFALKNRPHERRSVVSAHERPASISLVQDYAKIFWVSWKMCVARDFNRNTIKRSQLASQISMTALFHATGGQRGHFRGRAIRQGSRESLAAVLLAVATREQVRQTDNKHGTAFQAMNTGSDR